MTFVEAPRTLADMARITQLPAPQLVNLVAGGLTPLLPRDELARLGFAVVLYANAALRPRCRR